MTDPIILPSSDESQPANAIGVPLTQGFTAVIDSADFDLVRYSWQAKPKKGGGAYARRQDYSSGKRRWIWLHNTILARMIGRELTSGEVADHIDGNPLNNRRSNLRLATRLQNSYNKRRSTRNKTGYKGVTYKKRDRLFYANITVNGKTKYLGAFKNAEDAHHAYCEAARHYHGEFANAGLVTPDLFVPPPVSKPTAIDRYILRNREGVCYTTPGGTSMFEGMHQQNIADTLKGPVLRLPTPDQRKEGLAWIKRLESAEWHFPAFEQAFEEHGQSFVMDGDELTFDGGPKQLVEELAAIVQGYLDLIEPPGQDLFNTAEACRYVSNKLAEQGRKLSPSSVKEYIWERKMIRGQVVGNSMVFRKDDLDAFVESYLVLDPKRGRRWHKEEPINE